MTLFWTVLRSCRPIHVIQFSHNATNIGGGGYAYTVLPHCIAPGYNANLTYCQVKWWNGFPPMLNPVANCGVRHMPRIFKSQFSFCHVFSPDHNAIRLILTSADIIDCHINTHACMISGRHLCTGPLHTHRILGLYPANIKHLYNSCTMLVHQRRKTVVVQVLYKCFVIAGYAFISLGMRDRGDKKRIITQVAVSDIMVEFYQFLKCKIIM